VKRSEKPYIDYIPEGFWRIFPRRQIRANDGGVIDQDVDFSERRSTSRSQMLTFPPELSMRSPTARPMPWAPPVMIATRFSKSYLFTGQLYVSTLVR
jgi:hypothetical protein